jgi:hypothetical protein
MPKLRNEMVTIEGVQTRELEFCENNIFVGLKLSSLTQRWGRLKPEWKSLEELEVRKRRFVDAPSVGVMIIE